MNTVWHYAVWKWSKSYFMQPACLTDMYELTKKNNSESVHGITIIRGNVTCENCKRMMGMV